MAMRPGCADGNCRGRGPDQRHLQHVGEVFHSSTRDRHQQRIVRRRPQHVLVVIALNLK
jgi:hypothetical protein